MNQTAEGSGASFMEKVSAFIVDKRSLIFLITIILLIFSAFSRNWVEVESDLTYYLPEDSETKQALNVMDEQFITYGTAKIMVPNRNRKLFSDVSNDFSSFPLVFRYSRTLF